jgi:hypothetical protein
MVEAVGRAAAVGRLVELPSITIPSPALLYHLLLQAQEREGLVRGRQRQVRQELSLFWIDIRIMDLEP